MTTIIHSRLLSQFKDLEHGFGTRNQGDYQKNPNSQVIIPQQVHRDKIIWVGKKDRGRVVKGADGLLTRERGVKIGVRTADCLPILIYEKKRKVIGAIHVGWKGTFLGIIQNAIKEIFKKANSESQSLIVAFGPSIGMCCYDIGKKRAKAFIEKFGKDSLMIQKINGKPHLSLAYTNFKQLVNLGIKKENIDALPFCTSCQNDLFFSFRKEGKKKSFGEMLSYIMIKG